MNNLLKKVIVKISFDTLVDQLINALGKSGFTLSGITDFQREFMDTLGMHFKKYKVLAVHMPQLSHQMFSLDGVEGAVVPCNITLAELYPGEIEVITLNSTQFVADNVQNSSLKHLAEEMSKRLEVIIRSLERQSTGEPDLITSWS